MGLSFYIHGETQVSLLFHLSLVQLVAQLHSQLTVSNKIATFLIEFFWYHETNTFDLTVYLRKGQINFVFDFQKSPHIQTRSTCQHSK